MEDQLFYWHASNDPEGATTVVLCQDCGAACGLVRDGEVPPDDLFGCETCGKGW